MRRTYMVFILSAALAALFWSIGIGSVLIRLLSLWRDDLRWALGAVNGVVVSDDAVFVAASHNRVYKFALDGTIIDWVGIDGGPIRITRSGESIVVEYSGNQWALEDPGFQPRDPIGFTASVESTWYGHPLLVVDRSKGKRTVSMQPWYMTLLQVPYPGGACVYVGLAFSLLAVWVRRRMRRLKQGTSLPEDSGREVAQTNGV